jgi:uncharacterized protein (TIGR03382 family)
MTYLKHSFLLTFFLFAAAVAPLNADVLSGTGVWRPWGQSILLSASNTPVYGGNFWNNQSGDGPTMGIGWCLTGWGACGLANPPGLLPFYADAGGGALPNSWFTSASSAVNVTLRGVFTTQTSAANGVDYFGYYTLDSAGHVTSATRLLSAGDPLNTTTSFSLAPGTNYGFYVENVQGEGTVFETDYWFYGDSSQDTTNRGINLAGLQHVAVFDGGSSYYLGLEDTTGGACDCDYNDVIVQVTAVPEPGSIALALAGFVGLSVLLIRRRAVRF